VKTVFRILLVLVLCLEFAPFFVTSLRSTPQTIPETDIQRMSSESIEIYRSMVWRNLSYGALTIVCHFVAVGGQWFFWRPARQLYVLSSLLAIASLGATPIPLSGDLWQTLISAFYIVINVVIIIISYTRPVKEYFEKRILAAEGSHSQ
jgi:hypothetical protein